MNTELLARAARDKCLAHGACRLLLLMQIAEPNPPYAEQMGVVSTKAWVKQLRDLKYIDKARPGRRFHDSKKSEVNFSVSATG